MTPHEIHTGHMIYCNRLVKTALNLKLSTLLIIEIFSRQKGIFNKAANYLVVNTIRIFTNYISVQI